METPPATDPAERVPILKPAGGDGGHVGAIHERATGAGYEVWETSRPDDAVAFAREAAAADVPRPESGGPAIASVRLFRPWALSPDMAPPSAQSVEESEDYVHVRFRDPDDFDEIRTPDWAANAANSVSEGAEVRTGKREGSDDWEVQSVLIPKDVGEDEARDRAQEIVEKIED